MRSISDIEKELEFAVAIDQRNQSSVINSARKNVDEVFASSSRKQRLNLEKELVDAKAARSYELLGLKLHSPRFSPGTISLKVFSKLSAIFNDIIEQAAWREWDIGGNQTSVDEKFRNLIDLRLAGINSGSTELVFLGNIAPDLTGESALEAGLKDLFALLGASNNQIAIQAAEVGAGTSKSVINLMRFLESESISAEFSWEAPTGKLHWDGRLQQVTRIRSLLEEIGEPVIDKVERIGTVSALSRRRVQIELADGNKLNAKYSVSMREKVDQLHLNQKLTFFLEKTSYPADSVGVKRDAHKLLDFLKC